MTCVCARQVEERECCGVVSVLGVCESAGGGRGDGVEAGSTPEVLRNTGWSSAVSLMQK